MFSVVLRADFDASEYHGPLTIRFRFGRWYSLASSLPEVSSENNGSLEMLLSYSESCRFRVVGIHWRLSDEEVVGRSGGEDGSSIKADCGSNGGDDGRVITSEFARMLARHMKRRRESSRREFTLLDSRHATNNKDQPAILDPI